MRVMWRSSHRWPSTSAAITPIKDDRIMYDCEKMCFRRTAPSVNGLPRNLPLLCTSLCCYSCRRRFDAVAR